MAKILTVTGGLPSIVYGCRAARRLATAGHRVAYSETRSAERAVAGLLAGEAYDSAASPGERGAAA